MRPIRSAVFAATALLACSAAALAGDYIQRKDGTYIPAFKGGKPDAAADFEASDVNVLDADTDNVLYTILLDKKPQTQKMAASEVVEILPDPKKFPSTWKDAMNALGAGDWKGAAARFKAIGEDKTGRINSVVRQQALLKAARAAGNAGTKSSMNEADLGYELLLKIFPKTFYTRHVWKDRWEMYGDAGMEDKAKDAIDQLLKLPGVTDNDKLLARFALTSINLRKEAAAKNAPGIQKCHDEYKSLAGETEGKKDLASVNSLAKIGMGNCLLELNNANAAKTIFEEMCQREGLENSVNAAAFNGLGECWYRQGETKGWTEALRCFLRVECLYTDGASSDAIARAMCMTGDCFARLGDAAKAKAELSACIAKFPSSPWADRANKIRLNLPK